MPVVPCVRKLAVWHFFAVVQCNLVKMLIRDIVAFVPKDSAQTTEYYSKRVLGSTAVSA